MLRDMGLQPGRNCVVGEQLDVVAVGLYLQGQAGQGVQVALEMEEQRPGLLPEPGSGSSSRAYSLKRTRQRLLQACGWHLVTLAAQDWRKLDADQRQHYLAYCINHALGGGHGHSHSHAGGAHSHAAGSGCCGGGAGNAQPKHEHDESCGHGSGGTGRGGCGGGGCH